MKNESVATLRARREALLRELAQVGPFVQGSFYQRKTKCGNPNCRCASGERHTSCVLTKKVRGRTKCLHVPRDLHDEVEQWAKEHKRLKQLMKQISELSERLIRIHVRTSRAAARNRARSKPTPPTVSRECSDTTSPPSSSG